MINRWTVTNYKKYVLWNVYLPNALHSVCQWPVCVLNLKFLPSTVPDICRGSKILKGHVTLSRHLLTLFCFFSLGSSVVNLSAEFEFLASTVLEI